MKLRRMAYIGLAFMALMISATLADRIIGSNSLDYLAFAGVFSVIGGTLLTLAILDEDNHR